MIYLRLMGRIGNQLFMYAAARMVQILSGDNQEIIIDDHNNVSHDTKSPYENSLIYYPLKNVKYVHDGMMPFSRYFRKQSVTCAALERLERNMSSRQRFEFECRFQIILNRLGVVQIVDGYCNLPKKYSRNTYMYGYFQSEKYFMPIKDEIIDTFSLKDEVNRSNYPGLDLIRNRNTVCISAKVQHNVGNKEFDICNDGYYRRAIEYIQERVDNPLFFICSDNVEYVKEHFIDTKKYDVVLQDSSYPVHISLAVMAQSKHFIIGNTSFGWWAQYLSRNSGKMVVAPSRWYGVDTPCDIYQDNWKLIEV